MQNRIVKIKNTENMPYPIVGKIKVGKRDDTRGFPTGLDYFRADCNGNAVYENMFAQAHGDKPNTIPIVFLSDDTNACRYYYELRDSAGKVMAEGDGQNFRVAVFNPELKAVQWVDAPFEAILSKYGDVEAFMEAKVKQAGTDKQGKPMKWKEVLKLRFLLPKVSALGLLGVWEFRTSAAASSIPQIVDYFDAIKGSAGTARMIPFELQVRKVKSDKAQDSRSYPVVSMVANISADNVAMLNTVADSVSLKTGVLTQEKIKALAEKNDVLLPDRILLPNGTSSNA